jgi:hypothetical protein
MTSWINIHFGVSAQVFEGRLFVLDLDRSRKRTLKEFERIGGSDAHAGSESS